MNCFSVVFYFFLSWFISFIAVGGIASLIFGEEAMGSSIVGVLSFILALVILISIVTDDNKSQI